MHGWSPPLLLLLPPISTRTHPPVLPLLTGMILQPTNCGKSLYCRLLYEYTSRYAQHSGRSQKKRGETIGPIKWADCGWLRLVVVVAAVAHLFLFCSCTILLYAVREVKFLHESPCACTYAPLFRSASSFLFSLSFLQDPGKQCESHFNWCLNRWHSKIVTQPRTTSPLRYFYLRHRLRHLVKSRGKQKSKLFSSHCLINPIGGSTGNNPIMY